VEGEKAGIPSIVITTTGFTAVARFAAKAGGVEGLRIAEYPGPVGVHPDDLVRANVENVLLGRIIDGITKPIEGGVPVASPPERKPDEIVYRGTPEQITDFFIDQDWSDGLPIIPPTLERVEAFLKYTTRSPNERIAILPQARMEAFPWNIAANAVMAGCRPEHMPILIAAVEAIGDPCYNLNNIGTTWGVAPYLFVNGPIVNQLKIENKGQLISKGPNPVLGRALGLIVKNIAGYKLGKNYMATFGYPLNFAFAENEEDNPWEPYHVEHGFDKTVSTVTAGSTITWGWPPAIYGTSDQTAAETALKFLSIEMTKKPCLARLAERGPQGFRSMITVLLAPPVAKALAAAGYTKQKIREYVYEHARVPFRELEWLLKYGHSEAFTIRDCVRLGLYPEEYLVGEQDTVRVLPSPDVLHIVVCGDPSRNRIMTLWSGYVQPVTKKIELPENWEELLQKIRKHDGDSSRADS
jgi:hypothetical protein